jgi:large subunit ribosomal protein L15
VKLHDLHPAAGSRRPRIRVGRGIAAGKGKTAGRGTKGQRSRTGASIPSWFEGGQTPIHIRVPKLRGFTNRFKIEYAVVNVGQIAEYAASGRFGVELEPQAKPARGKAAAAEPVMTINAEVLASAGLIRSSEAPVKVLGQGDVTQKLFVAADAFSAAARRKIEEAGGFVQVLAPEKAPAVDEASAEVTEASAEPETPAQGNEAPTETKAPAEAKAATVETSAVPADKPAAPTDEPAQSAKPSRKRAAAKKEDAAE